MSRLGFRFSAVPRDRHPEWFELPTMARLVGHELYAASCDEKGRSRPIPVAANWRTSVCRLLCIEASDRPAISQCLSTMEKHGLVRVEDGMLSIV